MLKIFVFVLVFLGALIEVSYAQKNIQNQTLMWETFSVSGAIKKYPVQIELQQRHYINPIAQHQFLVRGQVGKSISHNWRIALGGAFFLQSPNDPKTTHRLAVPEIRPHVEAVYQQNASKTNISHRYRLETRIYHKQSPDKKELVDGYFYNNMRLRYRLQAVIPTTRFLSKHVAINVSNEVHLNIGEKIKYNVFDQNRLYGGLAVSRRKSQYEVGYLNWFQQQSSGIDFYNRHILRLGFNYKM
ncbi:MAG: DUF2490 domain-containing protein [Rhodothermia bacterium]|nr:DUF2490 domain-containing protein [Rhodothermia bacterium]